MDIARKLGVSSKRVEIVLNDLKQILQNETKETLLESLTNSTHGSNLQRREAKKIRDQLFGKECRICNKDCSGGILAIHRKDGEPHSSKKLWHPEELKNLKRDEWAPLCPRCHHMVTWLSEFFNMDWNHISKEVKRRKHNLDEYTPKLPDIVTTVRSIPSSASKAELRDLRFDIFGHECNICKRHKDDFKLILHRKDGKKHHRNSTWTVDFLKTANQADWIMLCTRCHNAVHWTMKQLGFSWNRIKKPED